jgi:hypothetical protein
VHFSRPSFLRLTYRKPFPRCTITSSRQLQPSPPQLETARDTRAPIVLVVVGIVGSYRVLTETYLHLDSHSSYPSGLKDRIPAHDHHKHRAL